MAKYKPLTQSEERAFLEAIKNPVKRKEIIRILGLEQRKNDNF